MLAVVLLAGDPGGRRARAIAWPDHLVERALVVDLHLLLDGLVFHHEKAPTLRVAAVGRAHPGPDDFRHQLVGDRIRLQPPHRPRALDDLEQLSHGRLLTVCPTPTRRSHRPSGAPAVAMGDLVHRPTRDGAELALGIA